MPARQREPLSRERIVRTALELGEHDGLDALTMRGLGRELGVEAMALYYYFPSKEALLDAIVEKAVAEMRPPRSDAGGWEERFREVGSEVWLRLLDKYAREKKRVARTEEPAAA